MKEFSTFDIMKILSIPRERLRDWMNRGFIVPTKKAQGYGTKAVFSQEDVYKVGLFKKLLEMGFKRKKAAVIIKQWPPNINFDQEIKEFIKALCQ
jgi:DNA-binding transcriptional MerR regulator